MRSIVLTALLVVGCGGGPGALSPAGAAGAAPAGMGGGGQSTAGSSGGGGAVDAASTASDAASTAPGAASTATGAGKPCGLRITDVKAVDESGDGHFVAPEGLTIRAVVENTGDAKGPVLLRVVADDPSVVPVVGEESRVERMAAGGHEALSVGFTIPKGIWPGSEIGFSLTATVIDDSSACPAAITEPYVVTTGQSTFDLQLCNATRQLQLSDVRVTGADGAIVPGSDFAVDLLLTNPGPLSADWYPHVEIASDDARIKVPQDLGALYLLSAGMSSRMASTMHVDASVPHGTHVTLTAWPNSTQVRCRNLPTLVVPVTVE